MSINRRDRQISTCPCNRSVLSRVLLCNPMTGALQAPLSMGFSRRKYWSAMPFPSTGIRSIGVLVSNKKDKVLTYKIKMSCNIIMLNERSQTKECILSESIYMKFHEM